MDKQKDLLQKAKIIAIKRNTSLSGLLRDCLNEIEKEEVYEIEKNRHKRLLNKGFDLGLKGRISWTREKLHER